MVYYATLNSGQIVHRFVYIEIMKRY